MARSLRLALSAVLLLMTVTSVLADDQLPTLPASGPGGLPSLSSVSSENLSMAPVYDQALNVTCYLGNPNDGQTLGGITVYSPADAGTNCNNLNYSCRGRCFGCYSDFDLSEDICVDASGRKYLR